MPRYADPDPPLPDVVTAAEAYGAGLTRDQVRQRVRSGRWRPLGRGVYDRIGSRPGPGPDAYAATREEHARRASAAALGFPGAAVALHSAAVTHGLPLWRPVPIDVAVNVPWGKWNGTLPGVVIHRMTMVDGDLVPGRVPVTSVARTCVDIARLLSLSDGLAVTDAALRGGLVDPAALDGVVGRCIDRRGIARARIVMGQANPLRESPAESASWSYFLRHRLPLPRMQVELRARSGLIIARVDFLWDEARLVGECDGRMKYAAAEDVYREKRREDEIRGEGYGVVRWGPADLRGAELARRLRRFLT
jgi:very-short-patch-repair endonuclease